MESAWEMQSVTDEENWDDEKGEECSSLWGQSVGVDVGDVILLSHPVLQSKLALEIYLFLYGFPRIK